VGTLSVVRDEEFRFFENHRFGFVKGAAKKP
jgi:hypothetical protein